MISAGTQSTTCNLILVESLFRTRRGRSERNRVHGVVQGRGTCRRHGVGLAGALRHLAFHRRRRGGRPLLRKKLGNIRVANTLSGLTEATCDNRALVCAR